MSDQRPRDSAIDYMSFLQAFRDEQSRYHDHKEISAWVTLPVYLAGAGAIVTGKIDDLHVTSRNGAGMLALGIILILFLLAVLVFWQLGRRRVAAIECEAGQRRLVSLLLAGLSLLRVRARFGKWLSG